MMIKLALFASLCCAQVALNQAALSGMMAQAFGVELPPTMPSMPKMPASLQAAIQAPQRRLQAQKQLEQQRAIRLRAMRVRQMQAERLRLQEDAKKNPYSHSRRRLSKSSRPSLPTNKSQINVVRPNVRQYGRRQSYSRRTYRKMPYSNTAFQNSQRAQNSVYSPANAVRRPAAQQLIGVKPANPYASNPYSVKAPTTQATAQKKNPYSVTATRKPANPYSQSRASNSNLSAVRNSAIINRNKRIQALRLQARKKIIVATKAKKQMANMKAIMEQPGKVMEASKFGCVPPAGFKMLSTMTNCQMQSVKAACLVRMQNCVKVGIGAMCCPPMVNKEYMEFTQYYQKMQKFMKQMENFMK